MAGQPAVDIDITFEGAAGKMRPRPTFWPRANVRVVARFRDPATGQLVDAQGVRFVIQAPGRAPEEFTSADLTRDAAGIWHLDRNPEWSGAWRVEVSCTEPVEAAIQSRFDVRRETIDGQQQPDAVVMAAESGEPIVTPGGAHITVQRIDRAAEAEALDGSEAVALVQGGVFRKMPWAPLRDAIEAPAVAAAGEAIDAAERAEAGAGAAEGARVEADAARQEARLRAASISELARNVSFESVPGWRDVIGPEIDLPDGGKALLPVEGWSEDYLEKRFLQFILSLLGEGGGRLQDFARTASLDIDKGQITLQGGLRVGLDQHGTFLAGDGASLKLRMRDNKLIWPDGSYDEWIDTGGVWLDAVTDQVTGNVMRGRLADGTEVGGGGGAAVLAPDLVSRIVGYGDSMTAFNSFGLEGGSTTFYRTDGPIAWLAFLSFQQLRFHTRDNFGVPSDTTAQMLERIPQVRASKADLAILRPGMNDAGGVPLAETAANIAAMTDACLQSGKRVAYLLIGPQGESAWSGGPSQIARRLRIQAINKAMVEAARKDDRLIVLDACAEVTDPSTGFYRAGYSMDGTHEYPAAAYARAKVMLAGLKHIIRPSQQEWRDRFDVYDPPIAGKPTVLNPKGNKLANATFEGVPTTITSGIFTGSQIPPGWVASHTNGTLTGGTVRWSIEPYTDGRPGNRVVFTAENATGVSNAAIYYLYQDLAIIDPAQLPYPTGVYAPGETLWMTEHIWVGPGARGMQHFGARLIHSTGEASNNVYGLSNRDVDYLLPILLTEAIEGLDATSELVVLPRAATGTPSIRVMLRVGLNLTTPGSASCIVKRGLPALRPITPI